MKVLLILSHPNEASFCASIAKRIKKGFEEYEWTDETVEVICHSLYEEEFFPVLPIEELKSKYSFDPSVQMYIDNLLGCDCLFFIHPDWWGQPPAILKGWLDRVFRPGIAYDYEGVDFEDKHPVPRLEDKKGCVIITTDLVYTEENQHYFEEIWNGRVFEYCGIQPCGVEVYYDMHNSTFGDRVRWLENLALNMPALLGLTDEPEEGD